MGIHQKMLAIMRDCESVAKTRIHPHHKFAYVGHEDVTTALGPLYRKHGVVRLVDIESVEVGDGFVAVKGSVTWIDPEASIISDGDQRLTSVGIHGLASLFDGKARNHGVAVGQAVSYAVKVAEMKCFSLLGDTEKELDVAEPRVVAQVEDGRVVEPDAEQADVPSPPIESDLLTLLSIIQRSDNPEADANPFLTMSWTKTQKARVAAAIKHRKSELEPGEFPYGANE